MEFLENGGHQECLQRLTRVFTRQLMELLECEIKDGKCVKHEGKTISDEEDAACPYVYVLVYTFSSSIQSETFREAAWQVATYSVKEQSIDSAFDGVGSLLSDNNESEAVQVLNTSDGRKVFSATASVTTSDALELLDGMGIHIADTIKEALRRSTVKDD